MSLMKILCDGKKLLRGSVAVAAISSALLLVACGGTSAPSDNGLSDSEGTIGSSSSSEKEPSSSSSVELNCSALLEGETGWSWNVPKGAYGRFQPQVLP